MKKINELKEEKSLKVQRMTGIVEKASNEKRSKSEDEKSIFDTLKKEVATIDAEIADLEEVERLNKENATEKRSEVNELNKGWGERFRDFLQESVERGVSAKPFKIPVEMRADPLISTTQTGIVNKEVGPINIMNSPGITFLQKLGATFYTGLNGNLTLNAQAEMNGGFVSEGADSSTASMAPESITLAARRVAHLQTFSRELLDQTNPAVFNTLLQGLIDGLGVSVCTDFFAQVNLDATGQISKMAAANGLVFGDVVNLEASLGSYLSGLVSPSYVTTNGIRGYLKQKPKNTYQQNIWDDGEVNGYPAYGVPNVAANAMWFGDWSKCAVGQWGSIDVILDPYTYAKSGKLAVTVTGLFDSGCANKRGVVRIADCSYGI